MTPQINLPRTSIEKFCKDWDIARLELFGSVLREDFSETSDVDFLVTFQPGSHRSLFDLVTMENQLSEIIGRKADLVSRRGIEQSKNWIRRKDILESAELFYAA